MKEKNYYDTIKEHFLDDLNGYKEAGYDINECKNLLHKYLDGYIYVNFITEDDYCEVWNMVDAFGEEQDED